MVLIKMKEEELFDQMISRNLTVETVIRDIVNMENLDPWDIDILKLTDKFVDAVKVLKKLNLYVSGQFLLAAAILLKMKADHLMPKILEELDSEVVDASIFEHADAELEPHVPLPKKRKVTLDELLKSLRNAMVVKERRTIKYKEREVKMKVRGRKIDIGAKIDLLFKKIMLFFEGMKLPEVKFSQLVPSKTREDIIWTFIPLLHIANKGKVRLRQEEDFGEIYVTREEEKQGRD